ncbi:SMI1/KNR4 family protein [Blastopirellula sp. JC732]|uniref:SMI1/KNR4 family protein n=1 Tax=Blastopirellula sediminis TaxID=2894196 RepID=A0A9X1MNS3_9BACT|nr:SMI1/KNR4 family protein [Blastopirellula sediminis]MCC9606531.1 SMI1/KNR4 family protein [Blastopirellula sediminis]MCC9630171.1 SMI1/KNR4 family protein [Blastopirellula sediminis]
MTIEEFVAARPDLVSCGRPSTAAEIDRFERELDFPVPLRIRAIWSQFGSGTLFETEDFFTPAVDLVTGESAYSKTTEMRRRGLSPDLVVIHSGLAGFTFLDPSGEIYQADHAHRYSPRRKYANFDDWFQSSLMAEYAGRYGLTY